MSKTYENMLEQDLLAKVIQIEESIIEAIEKRYMFNLIETVGVNKVDFWLLTDSPSIRL